jgi:hypothetical protein
MAQEDAMLVDEEPTMIASSAKGKGKEKASELTVTMADDNLPW